MSETLDSEHSRRAVALIADDLYVNGQSQDVRAHRKWRPSRGPEPEVRRDETWGRYVYFFHVGDGLTSSSGFRYTGESWKPHGPTIPTMSELDTVFQQIRDAGDPPVEDKWNAAVVTYDRRAGTGDLHLFYGDEAENWHMTPATQQAVAEAGLELFDEPEVS